MRLREILTELNTRSKKISPNIFNEPIECGFEAEVVWEHINDKKIRNWEDAMGILSDEYCKIIWEYAKDKIDTDIKRRDIEIDDEESKALERFIEEERVEHEENEEEFDEDDCVEAFYDFYDRPYNDYREAYLNDRGGAIRKTIQEEIEEKYGNNVMEFIKAHVPDFSIKKALNGGKLLRDGLPEFITNEWVLNYSSIKNARNYWAGKRVNNYYVDEYGKEHNIDNKSVYKNMWHFAEDGSLRSDSGAGVGIEIISPVYPTISDMFEDMRSLFAWLVENDASGNYSTGLHVTMNMKDWQKNMLNKLKLYTLASDEYILDDFNRKNTAYAKSIIDVLKKAIIKSGVSSHDIQYFKNIEDDVNCFLKSEREKYRSINVKTIKSEEGNNLVEFRSAGGYDYIEEENFHKIENAVKHYAICLKSAYNDVDYQDDYKRLLKRLVHKIEEERKTKESNKRKPYMTPNNKVYPFIFLMQKLMYPRSFEYFYNRAYFMYAKPKFNVPENKNMFIKILCQMCVDIVSRNIKTTRQHYKILKNTMKEFDMEEIKPNDIDFSEYRTYITDYNLRISGYRYDYTRVVAKGLKELLKFDKKPYEYKIHIQLIKDGYVFINSEFWEYLKVDKYDDIYKLEYDYFDFRRNNLISQGRNIILIPRECVNLLNLANKLLNRSYDDGKSVKNKKTKKIKEKIKDIYDVDSVKYFIRNLRTMKVFHSSNYKELIEMLNNHNVEVEIVPVSSMKNVYLPTGFNGTGDEILDLDKQIDENTSLYNHLFNLERLCD